MGCSEDSFILQVRLILVLNSSVYLIKAHISAELINVLSTFQQKKYGILYMLSDVVDFEKYAIIHIA